MEYRNRRLVKHEDLNPAGTLFGGRVLEWIDEEAAIFCRCQLKYPDHIVTKIMSSVNFMAPARLGDIVEFGMNVVKLGNTSITIEASVRNKHTQEEIVKIDQIVFVNLGDDGKPKPHNVYSLPNSIPKAYVASSNTVTKVIVGEDPKPENSTYTSDDISKHGMGKSSWENDRWDD